MPLKVKCKYFQVLDRYLAPLHPCCFIFRIPVSVQSLRAPKTPTKVSSFLFSWINWLCCWGLNQVWVSVWKYIWCRGALWDVIAYSKSPKTLKGYSWKLFIRNNPLYVFSGFLWTKLRLRKKQYCTWDNMTIIQTKPPIKPFVSC